MFQLLKNCVKDGTQKFIKICPQKTQRLEFNFHFEFFIPKQYNYIWSLASQGQLSMGNFLEVFLGKPPFSWRLQEKFNGDFFSDYRFTCDRISIWLSLKQIPKQVSGNCRKIVKSRVWKHDTSFGTNCLVQLFLRISFVICYGSNATSIKIIERNEKM